MRVMEGGRRADVVRVVYRTDFCGAVAAGFGTKSGAVGLSSVDLKLAAFVLLASLDGLKSAAFGSSSVGFMLTTAIVSGPDGL